MMWFNVFLPSSTRSRSTELQEAVPCGSRSRRPGTPAARRPRTRGKASTLHDLYASLHPYSCKPVRSIITFHLLLRLTDGFGCLSISQNLPIYQPPTCLSVYLSAYPLACPPVCLRAYLPVYLVCRSIQSSLIQ